MVKFYKRDMKVLENDIIIHQCNVESILTDVNFTGLYKRVLDRINDKSLTYLKMCYVVRLFNENIRKAVMSFSTIDVNNVKHMIGINFYSILNNFFTSYNEIDNNTPRNLIINPSGYDMTTFMENVFKFDIKVIIGFLIESGVMIITFSLIGNTVYIPRLNLSICNLILGKYTKICNYSSI